MLHIYCPVCRGRLELQERQTEAVCVNCGTLVPIPKAYDELESFFNYAFEERARRDFASAERSYAEILKKHPDSAAAHWDKALSHYGIEYQPIGDLQYRLVCHRAQDADFLQNEDVKAALASTDAEAEAYREEAGRIAKLQAEVRRVSAIADPCDALIAPSVAKEADRNRAAAIATMAKAAGLRVCNPVADYRQMPRQDWEPYLYQAYHTASVLLVPASGADSFTPELMFDVQRFLYRKVERERAAEKGTLKIVLVFSDMDEYEDIPDEIFEAFDQRLPAEAPDFAARFAECVSGGVRDYGDALRKGGAGGSHEYVNKLQQARLAIEKGEFERAMDLYEEILNKNPRESQAYWGQLLCKYRCSSEKELIECATDVRSEGSYRSAMAFATEREQQTYREVAGEILEAIALQKRRIEEEQRAEEERKRERARQGVEVERAQVESTRREKTVASKLAVLLVVILALAGTLLFGGYKLYQNKFGWKIKAYREAGIEYSYRNFEKAAELYQELGDYKDSPEMYEQCMAMYYLDLYHAMLRGGREAYDAELLEEMLEYVPEAQDLLDELNGNS